MAHFNHYALTKVRKANETKKNEKIKGKKILLFKLILVIALKPIRTCYRNSDVSTIIYILECLKVFMDIVEGYNDVKQNPKNTEKKERNLYILYSIH